MRLVINIPDEEYKRVMDGKWEGNDLADYIEDGTPLPKGHGKIIDESAITEVYTDVTEPVKINGMTVIPTRIVIAGTNAPTIIEADRSEEE